ncbi:hypothetical protein Anas_00239, partial [Armadillidium nasatum]
LRRNIPRSCTREPERRYHKRNSHIKVYCVNIVIENGKIKVVNGVSILTLDSFWYGQILTRIPVLCDFTSAFNIQNFVASVKIGNLKEKRIETDSYT